MERQARREPRYPVNDSARVFLLNVPQALPVDGRVSDLSKSGLSVYLDEPLPPGSLVKVELHDTVVVGAVRHCQLTDSGCKVGVAIDEARFYDHVRASAPDEKAPAGVWDSLKKLCRAITTGI